MQPSIPGGYGVEQMCHGWVPNKVRGSLYVWIRGPSFTTILFSLMLCAGGSWSQSCTSTSWTSSTGMLAGVCSPTKTVNQLDYYLCCGDATVGNNHGLLQCNCYNTLPGGSWLGTCSPAGFANGVLSAYCQQSNQGSYPQSFSNLDIEACGGYNPSSAGFGVSVVNSNGNLIC